MRSAWTIHRRKKTKDRKLLDIMSRSWGRKEKPETGESVADAQAPYPVENAGHNYAVDNSSPQGLKLTAGMADKPVQRASLREKLEAFKAKAAGTEKQENRKEKGRR